MLNKVQIIKLCKHVNLFITCTHDPPTTTQSMIDKHFHFLAWPQSIPVLVWTSSALQLDSFRKSLLFAFPDLVEVERERGLFLHSPCYFALNQCQIPVHPLIQMLAGEVDGIHHESPLSPHTLHMNISSFRIVCRIIHNTPLHGLQAANTKKSDGFQTGLILTCGVGHKCF